MNDKRRLERKTPNQVIEVFNVLSGETLGQLANITSEGLMLIAAAPITPGTLFQLHMPLNEPTNGITAIDFGVEALWCQEADSSGRYWVGMHIIDISPQNIEGIECVSRDWEVSEV
jgi:hypothetical protein